MKPILISLSLFCSLYGWGQSVEQYQKLVALHNRASDSAYKYVVLMRKCKDQCIRDKGKHWMYVWNKTGSDIFDYEMKQAAIENKKHPEPEEPTIPCKCN
jgi:hypothetical protein